MSHQSTPWPLLYWRRPSPPTLPCNLITCSLTWKTHPDTVKYWFTRSHEIGIKFHWWSKRWSLSYGKHETEQMCCNSAEALWSWRLNYCFNNCWLSLMTSHRIRLMSFEFLSLRVFTFPVLIKKRNDKLALCVMLWFIWSQQISGSCLKKQWALAVNILTTIRRHERTVWGLSLIFPFSFHI